MSGTWLQKMERLAEVQRLSMGELSRAIVLQRLEGETDLRKLVDMIETLSQHHRKQTEALGQTIEELSSEVAALRTDFNRAVGKE